MTTLKISKPERLPSGDKATVGSKLNDELCAFFKRNSFLIGLSVDGPREIHDSYRVNKGGEGSFEQVMRGLENLQKHTVDCNILCTVSFAGAES